MPKHRTAAEDIPIGKVVLPDLSRDELRDTIASGVFRGILAASLLCGLLGIALWLVVHW